MNILRFYRPRVAIVGLLALSLAACSQAGGGSQPPETLSPTQPVNSDTPTSPGTTTGKAQVDSVEIRMLESFPVQVNVTAKGNLPDPCTTIDRVDRQRNGNAFIVTITTARPTGKMCAAVIVPYEKSFALDVVGLKAGIYTVNVNGVSETFELKSDNKLP